MRNRSTRPLPFDTPITPSCSYPCLWVYSVPNISPLLKCLPTIVKTMRILFKFIRNWKDSPRKGQDVMSNVSWETNIPSKTAVIEHDCTSEPFTKPDLSTLVNKTMLTLGSKKQSNTLDTFKYTMNELAVQLDRVTTKVFGESKAYRVVDDLSLGECEDFIFRWSEELKCLRSKYRCNLGKISNVGSFRRSLEGLNIREDQFKKLTEAQEDFHWFIHVLKSLPKSSVCQEGCARVELFNLYRQWKKGHLISMLPIMDFVMKTLLKEKDSVLKWRLQHRSESMETGSSVPLQFYLHLLKNLIVKFSL